MATEKKFLVTGPNGEQHEVTAKSAGQAVNRARIAGHIKVTALDTESASRLAAAIDHFAPDDLEKIAAALSARMEREKKSKKGGKP
jgi:hypothetical protein